MNALLAANLDTLEGNAMPSNEDIDRAEQLGALRSDVSHIQSDITEIKADIRGLGAKLDRTDAKLDALRDDLSAKIDAKTDALRAEFSAKIDAIKESIASAKVWAVLMYVTFAGSLLYAMARGLKWF